MKIAVTLKDPDGVYDSVNSAVAAQVEAIEGMTGDERQEIIEIRQDEVSSKLKKWIKYGEYVTIVFDTIEMTATVKENG